MIKNKRILVTGATGLLGSHLVEILMKQCENIRIIKHKRDIPTEIKSENIEIIEGDLVDKKFAMDAVKGMDYVFHLAAFTGGLGRTGSHPASTLTPNLVVDGNVLDAARLEGVERFLYGSCACIYPNSNNDLTENQAWNGDPPQVHASYSWSKRMGELQAISYHKEYGMKIAIVRPSNSYGPRDSFDPKNSHVIGSLIQKAAAKTDPFVLWGDGTPIREFIYAKDAAEGMITAIEKYYYADPVNLSGEENIRIDKLAQTILNIFGYSPKIVFDTTKPNGQQRRVLNGEKARASFDFKAKTNLHTGLQKTINWYLKNLN